jgi:hypothetical protein
MKEATVDGGLSPSRTIELEELAVCRQVTNRFLFLHVAVTQPHSALLLGAGG